MIDTPTSTRRGVVEACGALGPLVRAARRMPVPPARPEPAGFWSLELIVQCLSAFSCAGYVAVSRRPMTQSDAWVLPVVFAIGGDTGSGERRFLAAELREDTEFSRGAAP